MNTEQKSKNIYVYIMSLGLLFPKKNPVPDFFLRIHRNFWKIYALKTYWVLSSHINASKQIHLTLMKKTWIYY